jgi:hypothetical protein
MLRAKHESEIAAVREASAQSTAAAQEHARREAQLERGMAEVQMQAQVCQRGKEKTARMWPGRVCCCDCAVEHQERGGLCLPMLAQHPV